MDEYDAYVSFGCNIYHYIVKVDWNSICFFLKKRFILIKGENILVDSNNEIKLADFVMAKHVKR